MKLFSIIHHLKYEAATLQNEAGGHLTITHTVKCVLCKNFPENQTYEGVEVTLFSGKYNTMKS
jgi:hypothetical protein